MIKAKAKRWIKVNGEWFPAGTEIVLTGAEAEKLAGAVAVVAAAAPEAPEAQATQAKPKKSRKKAE